MKEPNWIIKGYSTDHFSDEVIARWGKYNEELQENAGLIHCQMSILAQLCLENPNETNDIMLFLGEALDRDGKHSGVADALSISFLEWPNLEKLSLNFEVPENVSSVVKEQWDRFGSNA
ncbi:MAG: hypothetical protein AAF607_09245 [Pseudomonadota bacterium]